MLANLAMRNSERPSVSVFVPGIPTTSANSHGLDTILKYLIPACQERGFPLIRPDQAVRVGLIHCFPNRGVAGNVIDSGLDVDNLAVPPLRALKINGYPLEANASVAVTDSLKVTQDHAGTIITLAPIDVAFDPALFAPINHNAILGQFSHLNLAPLQFPQAPILQDGMRGDVDFLLPGNLNAIADKAFLRERLLQAFYIAARECLFPEKIPKNALIHITVAFVYPPLTNEEEGALKVTPTDIPKLLKPFLDALRVGPKPYADDPEKPLPDDRQAVSLRALKMFEPGEQTEFPFIKPGIFCHMRIVRDEKDLQPPDDFMDRWRAAWIRHLQRQITTSQPALPSVTSKAQSPSITATAPARFPFLRNPFSALKRATA